MKNTLDDEASARRPEPAQPVTTAGDFTFVMLDAARELNRNEDLRREVARRIS